MSRSRGWCFTLNNYSLEEHSELLALESNYVIIGEEIGAEGTPHLQGFVQFKTLKQIKGLKKLNSRCHWEPTKGTIDQNIVYCSKEGHFQERGLKPVSQEKKGELGKQSHEERWALAKAGKFDQLPPEQIKIYEYIHQKFTLREDRNDLDNFWYFGCSGCGKSSKVRADYPVFYAKPMSKWWDGYSGEDVVVLDDVDPSHTWLPYFLKIWTDHYVFNAEVKGGMLKARPKTFIVTSQYSIAECFPDPRSYEALARRFKQVSMEQKEAILFLN